MMGMERARERTLYESSFLSSGSIREAKTCESDLEKDQIVTYKNGKNEKS